MQAKNRLNIWKWIHKKLAYIWAFMSSHWQGICRILPSPKIHSEVRAFGFGGSLFPPSKSNMSSVSLLMHYLLFESNLPCISIHFPNRNQLGLEIGYRKIYFELFLNRRSRKTQGMVQAIQIWGGRQMREIFWHFPEAKTIFICSSLQLPRLGLEPSKGFWGWQGAFQGPATWPSVLPVEL